MAGNKKSNFIVRGGFDGSGIAKGLQRTQKKFSTFQTGLKKTMKLVGATLGAVAIGALVKESVTAASELEGAFIGLESILAGQGKSFGKAKSFINDYIDDGLVPLGDAVTAYKNLAARGYDDDQIQQVMTSLKDAAAFGRQSSYSLGEAVSTATEGLKNENSVLVDNAGVTKNVSKMWQDYAKSIGKTTAQLTQEEKIQAEVNGIIEETRFQVGDAAKYADTYAGRVASLSKTLKDIKVNLGNAFIPIINTVLPILQTLGSALSRATATFAQFSQALFGKAAKPKAIQQQAEAVSALGDATEEAAAQAKGAVAGFDEINQVSDDSGGGAEESATGVAAIAPLAEMNDETGGAMGELSTKATEMAEKLKASFESLKTSVVENKDIILPALGAIAGGLAGIALIQGFQGAVDGLKKLGTAASGAWKLMAAHPILVIIGVIAALVGAFITAYKTNDEFRAKVDKLWATLKEKLEPVFTAISNAISWLWDKVLKPAGQFLVAVFLIQWIALSETLEWLWHNVLVPLGDFFAWLWEKVLKPIGSAIVDVLGAAFKVLGDIAMMVWDNVLKPLADFFISVFGAAIEGVKEIMSHWWNNILKPIGAYLKATFQPIFENLAKVFVYLWRDVLKPLIEWIWNKMKPVFEDVFGGIKGLINGLKRTFTGLITFITGIFTGNWKKAWEGVKDIFGGIWDGLVSLAKVPINLVIKAINWMIDGLNKIKIDVPEWLQDITGMKGSIGFNIGKIPELARGGIVSSPTLAMVGERGPEAIVPLENTGFVDAIASAVGTAVLGALQMGQGNDGRREVVMILNDREIGRVMLPSINNEATRRGYKPILQYGR